MPYRRPHRYTPDELREMLIDDLEADHAFSLASDPDTPEWRQYRARIRAELAHLRAGGDDDRLVPLC